jgi:hypothetical protein
MGMLTTPRCRPVALEKATMTRPGPSALDRSYAGNWVTG